MTTIPAIITDAGMAAAIAAGGSGLAVTLTELAVGDGAWSPDSGATALQNEIARVGVGSALKVDNSFHLTGTLSGPSEFTVRELGFFTNDGTLFAVWSDPVQPLSAKTAGCDVLLSFVLELSAVPDGSVTVEVVEGSSLEIVSRLIQIQTTQAEVLTAQLGYDAAQDVQDGRLDVIEADLASLEVPANLETRLVALENFDAALVIPPDLSIAVGDNTAAIVALDTRVTSLETDVAALDVPESLESRLIALETFDASLVIPPDLSDTVDSHATTLAALGTAATRNVGTASNQIPLFSQLPIRSATLVTQSVYTGDGPYVEMTHVDISGVSVSGGVLTITQTYHYQRSSDPVGGST